MPAEIAVSIAAEIVQEKNRYDVSYIDGVVEDAVRKKENGIIRTFCTVKTDGKTGVEMEALTGVQVTLLTIYDMCKAIDKHMVMTDIHLVEKTGGKSGDFLFKEIKTKGGEK